MTAPDRTEELVRAMLERRASQPMPGWLFDQTMHAIVVAPQARTSRWSWQVPPSTAGRLALVATMALVLTLLAAGALLAAGVLHLPPAPPRLPAALAVDPSPSSSSVADPSEEIPLESAEPTPKVTAKPPPTNLAPDSMAVVTAAGDGLRVRSAPGTGSDSKRLTPLLPKGTRMLVVDGPVSEDGHDWYQVKAANEEGLFGWVSSGKDGEQWIRETAPACPDTLDETAPWTVPAMDFLVCYGDAPVTVRVMGWQEPGLENGEGSWVCPWTGEQAYCALDPDWLATNMYFMYVHDGEAGEEGTAAVAPGVDAGQGVGSPAQGAMLTLAMDAPEAAACRVVDGRGRDVLPPEQAVLACRLTFVVRDMEWEPAAEIPALPIDSLARVGPEEIGLWNSPREPTRDIEGFIEPGGLVYVNERWPETGPVEWYGVLNGEPQDPRYGWVRAPTDLEQLVPVEPACAPMTDWSAFLELSRLERLVCTTSEPVTLDMNAWVMQPANPEWSEGCGAWASMPSGGGVCRATPEWLATFSGVMIQRPGDMEMFATYDPSVLDRSAIPTSETWVRVTGTWESPASSECRVQDATTGSDLLPPEVAAIYCRATFVITEIGPATTSP